MIRGEVLLMRTTLFNYFEDELSASVTLKENEWYDLVKTGDKSSSVLQVTIPRKDSVTVVFPIKFKKVGTAKVSVRAQSNMAGDAVERSIVVKPEGIPKIESFSSIIDHKSSEDPATAISFNVDIPEDAVEGSVHVKFSVSGNILGTALSNLGNLLLIPSGCAEQTMAKFAPDVYIGLYLKKSGKSEPEIEKKYMSHIVEGYQNELRYQRSDGSFSAFGYADRSGSTWLTAFVTKCFIAAKQLNSDLIEDSKIEQAVKYLLKNQNDDGTFTETGRVIYENMQGGVYSNETIAAYILIALAEGGSFENDEKVQAAMMKTQTYLEGRIDSVKDIYTLSIMSYALALVESDAAERILTIIDENAIIKQNIKYWKMEEYAAAKCKDKRDYCPFNENKPSTTSIEITAYVLLTYVKMGRIDTVMPIVRWLAEQRGAFGGYYSTQDTVMAIQALSTVAGFFSERVMDLEISVTHDGKQAFIETFEVDEENEIVLQMAELPAMPGMVTVTAAGQGFADVQVTVAYNLPVGPRIDEPFELTVEVKEKYRGDIIVLKICASIEENRREVLNSTGMFVISATLPSGYTVDDKEATKNNIGLKLVELDNGAVTGYFDQLPKGKTVCLSLNLNRYAEISDLKAQRIEAYDYYRPKNRAFRQYSPPGSGVCDLCGSDCHGCPPKPTEIDESSLCKEISYPCPNFTDGLYYDSGSHISKMMNKYSTDEVCSAPNGAGDSSMYDGLPGSLLNGINQFIDCSGTPYFENILADGRGFTLSIMVYPTELKTQKYYTVFSIGAKGTRLPYVIFAKKLGNQYALKIRWGEFEYNVRSISTEVIPINKWTLVTVKMTSCDAYVYINGVVAGKRSRNQEDIEEIDSEITLKVGKPHLGGKSRGNFVGLVSSLNIWSAPLTDDQIMDHYNYYSPVMNLRDPMMSKIMVHYAVPKSLHHCFDHSFGASDLKSRVGDLRTSCDEPNGQKPPVNFVGFGSEELTSIN